MPAIRCTLVRDVFEGGEWDDPGVAEWPPSWMRLFSALVSVADPGGADDGLLKTLERADPPSIYASPAILLGARRAWVPTNRVVEGSSTTTLAGRTNSERTWARAVPQSTVVWYHWPRLDFDAGRRERLSQLCRRVPYLGRSTSPVIVELVDEAPPDDEPLVPQTAVGEGRRFQFAQTVRVPYEGALDALRYAHAAKYERGQAGDPWEIGQHIDYGRAVAAEPVHVDTSPYEAMVVLRLHGPELDGRHTVRLTRYLQRALMGAIEDRHGAEAVQRLPWLHGHHDGEVTQVALLGLPHVGHRHADGHLLGLALALPSLPREQLMVLREALEAVTQNGLTAGPFGVLTVAQVSPLDAGRAWGLRPERWMQPHREWVTALPMVFDRYLKRHHDIESEAARAIVHSGYPEPVAVTVAQRPMLDGGVDLAPTDTTRRPTDSGFKPYRHVRVRFPQAVRGPVVVGSMRHYGLGLCVPRAASG